MRRLIYPLLLVGVTAVWGWTFFLIHEAIAVYSVLGFLTIRFALAALALAPFSVFRLTRRDLLLGGGLGTVLSLLYLFQTLGLAHTTPTNSGLITGLFVAFAPLAAWLLFGERLNRPILLAISLSLTGLILVAGNNPTGINIGDALTLIGAGALGLHIVLLSRYSPGRNTASLTFTQMLSAAVIFAVTSAVVGTPFQLPPREVLGALLVTGLVASAGAYYVQTFVQRKLPAARTAVILTMEPVFAAIFGYFLAGDRLTGVQITGGALILSALFVGEAVPLLGSRETQTR